MKTLFRAAHSVVLPTGNPPEWVQLLPLGASIHARDGRGPYVLPDIQAARSVIAATMAHQSGADLPIDYDHQIIWSRDNGRPAPASGWIKELEARADGIWGRVEWTAEAADLLRNKAYRYLSPVFMHTQDGTVTRLACAALTNIPNLELTALASQLPGGETAVKPEDFLKQLAGVFKLPGSATAEQLAAHAQKLVVELAALAKALGLPDESDAEKLAAHAQKLVETFKTGLAAVGKAVGAPDGATIEQIAAHAQKLGKPGEKRADGAPDPSQWVPMSQFTSVNDRLKVLEGERVAELVEDAIKGGKIPPANRDWAKAYASKDEAGFKEFLKNAVPVVTPGASGPSGQPQGGDGLSPEDMAVCSQLGLSAEDFKKTRALEKEGK